MPIQPVICVLKNGVSPVRGSQKLLKNGSKKERFLGIKNTDLADVIIVKRAIYMFLFFFNFELENLDGRSRSGREYGNGSIVLVV